MRRFDWEAKYTLNVPEIDAQHQKLFFLLRGLQLDAHELTGQALAEKISELQCYCYEHFVTEENFMIEHKTDLPMFDEHVGQHKNFIAVTNGFIMRAKSEGSAVAQEACAYFGSWLVSHIYTMDKRTFAALQALDASNPVAHFERAYNFDIESVARHKGKMETERLLNLRAQK